MQQDLIPAQEKSRLRRTFRKDLKADVVLRLFTQKPSPIAIPGRDCRFCAQTQQLLEELTALSPKLTLETVDFYGQPDAARELGVSRIPAIVMGDGAASRLRFYGIPMGYGLATLIEDIKTLSMGKTPLGMAARKSLRELNHPVHIQVFTSPNSQDSAPIALLAHALALENEHIIADVVEIEEFPALAQAYGVRSAPVTVINEYTKVAGTVNAGEIVEKVLEAGIRTTEAPV